MRITSWKSPGVVIEVTDGYHRLTRRGRVHPMERTQRHEPQASPPESRETSVGPRVEARVGRRAPDEPRTPEEQSTGRQAAGQARTEDTLLQRAAGWIVPQHNPAGAVYGLITIGALLAAESGLRDTYPETVGSAALAVVLYWFAHSYSDVLGLRLAEQQRFSRDELWTTFARDWSIATGSSLPLLALIVAWVTGASQSTAVTAAVWTVVVSLIAFELIAGIRSRAKAPELLLEALVGTTMGLAILALRALLH
jgi:hypothetical protein